jgi:hypothetical protein
VRAGGGAGGGGAARPGPPGAARAPRTPAPPRGALHLRPPRPHAAPRRTPPSPLPAPPCPPPNTTRCGTPHPGADVAQRVEFRVAAHLAKEAARGAAGGVVYNIPTYVYNVVIGGGKGAVPEATLRAQVDALNAAYATAFSSDGASLGTSADNPGITWKFDLQSIQTVNAGDMCDNANEKAIKAANRKGGKGALNLYITDLSSCGLLGYSTWPWELDPKAGKADAVRPPARGPNSLAPPPTPPFHWCGGSACRPLAPPPLSRPIPPPRPRPRPRQVTMDAVVIHHETLPGGTYKPYDMGRSAIHETGGCGGFAWFCRRVAVRRAATAGRATPVCLRRPAPAGASRLCPVLTLSLRPASSPLTP